ncbi:MAG: thioredoxin [Flavobacteriaceae bacterium]|nr:thioredoxin [Flavobacteriaceae bacterium]
MMASFQEIVKSNHLVLVEFWADWCGPCKMLAPILEQVKNHMGDKIKVVTIDVEKNEKLVAQMMIAGVPTLMIFRNGEQVWKESGVLQSQDLIRIIEKELEK